MFCSTYVKTGSLFYLSFIAAVAVAVSGCSKPKLVGHQSVLLSASVSAVPARSQATFIASEGAPPYLYSIESGGGTIDPNTGVYIAPNSMGEVIVRVVDALGNTASMTLPIDAGLLLSPTPKTLTVGETFTFTATGGLGPYVFSLVGGGPGSIIAGATTVDYTALLVAGSATVRVTDSLGITADAEITISLYPAPTVSAITPNEGTSLGGTAVLIDGTGFRAGATVSIGGVNCSGVSVVSATQITCTTGARAAALVDVVVTNTDAQFGTLANGFTYFGAPIVLSVSPNSGVLAGGTPVTISGSGFRAGATVDFSGSACVGVTVVNSNQITCTTSAHAAGAVTAMVTNTDSQFGFLAGGYTYQAAPTVTAISPNAGPLAGGQSVTITGTGFVSGATASLGGSSCGSVTVVSSTQITCTTSAHAAGAVNVVVTNPDTQFGTLSNGYTYQSAPTVTAISPNAGSTGGGTAVTITGTGFLAGASASLGGSNCGSLTVVSATSITCTTSAHAAGAVDVVVTNSDSQAGTLAGGYTYQGAPTVTAINPNAGPIAGGQSVTITGTGFLAGATASLGGSNCGSLTVVSSTSITCTTSAHAAGAVNVVVTNTDTQSGTLTSGYTYQLDAPTVTAISPNAGPLAGSTAVTITGTGFVSGASASLGGSSCGSLTVVSATSITCTTSAHAAGVVDVVVTNPDTQSGTLSNGYTYQGAPTVTAISPNAGPLAGGQSVTITGTGFLAGASASLGGSNCGSLTVVSSTSITCTTSAHAAGAVNVVVTNTDTQSGTLTNGYTYQSAPTVTAISPNAGSTAGSTNVTITGSGFLTGATASLGGSSCGSLTVVSSTEITCTTSAHAAGAVNVVVMNTDAQSGTLTNGYTYQGAPTVTAISPNIGAPAGGQSVTITGTGFLAGATASLGGSNCGGLTVVSATSITCTTSAHAAAVVDVVVTNSDSQFGTLSSGYTYQAAPTVTAISPTSGTGAGGTNVTITGTGFLSGAMAAIGGVNCGSLTVVSATSITCTTGAHAAAVVNVVVTNTDSQSGTLTNGYTYTAPPPTITSISPSSGSAYGGTAVTIIGTGFVTGASVTFIHPHPFVGNVTCTSVSVNGDGTQITCTAGAAGYDPDEGWGPVSGVANVKVQNPDTQSDTENSAFTYFADIAKLGFTVQPSSTVSSSTISPSVKVAIQDTANYTVTTASGTITLSILTNPSGGTLSGTTSVVVTAPVDQGVATFSNLSIDKAGAGYVLRATKPHTGWCNGGNNTYCYGDSAGFSITAASPTKIVFTSGPYPTAINTCSPAYTIQTQDPNSNPSAVASDTNVTISENGGGSGTFYSDASCVTPLPANQVTISAGQHTKTFYTIHDTRENYTITADAGGPSGLTAGTKLASVKIRQVFSYTGVLQNFAVPADVTEITVKAWGGAGGARTTSQIGGGGGFAQADVAVTPLETLNIIVGGGGVTLSGGGRSSIYRVTEATDALVVAGGGGGSGYSGSVGGAGGGATGITGGGATGVNGYYSGGGGGTQAGGGAAGGAVTAGWAGTAGTQLVGGSGYGGGAPRAFDGGGAAGAEGGGGGGWYGGGGGGREVDGNDDWIFGGGGGGSSYTTGSNTQKISGSGRNAGNNTDSDYSAGIGYGGGSGNANGGNGRIVIWY